MTACFFKQVLTISNTYCLEGWHSTGNDSLLLSKANSPENYITPSSFEVKSLLTLSNLDQPMSLKQETSLYATC